VGSTIWHQTKEEAICRLVSALEKVGKTESVHEVHKMCPRKVQGPIYSGAIGAEERQPLMSENKVSHVKWGSLVVCGKQIPGKWIMGVFSSWSLVLVCLLSGLLYLTVAKFSVTNGPARSIMSIRFQEGVMVDEFSKCPRNQSNIPKFPPDSSNWEDGTVGFCTKELGILLCHETDEGDIFGDESSNPNQDCYNSYKTQDLGNISAGWQKTETQSHDRDVLSWAVGGCLFVCLLVVKMACNARAKLREPFGEETSPVPSTKGTFNQTTIQSILSHQIDPLHNIGGILPNPDAHVDEPFPQQVLGIFDTYHCPAHTEISIVAGAMKIKCMNKPLTVQARLCQPKDFENIFAGLEKRGLVSLVNIFLA
jgi:hypothetical protein